MARRVAIVGMGQITAFGETWEDNRQGFLRGENCVEVMPEWGEIKGLVTQLGAPCKWFKQPENYTRKQVRSMSRVSLMATRATEIALSQAGLIGDPILKSGRVGVAYGSSWGSVDAVKDFAAMITEKSTGDLTANSYVRMMPQTTPVNISIFFGINGRIIPTSSACTSGSMAIGYAYEAIKLGLQDAMAAGGAEELSPCDAGVFDTLYATSSKNDAPKTTPSPFDADRDGLVIGEGAGTLVLEELEHARARGAAIYGEIVGFATNSDATHITSPNMETITRCIKGSLDDAKLSPSDIGYISAHGTGTSKGDIAESNATERVFGGKTPISSLKGYFGHTLGACGAVEAINALMMMKEGWFCQTPNLRNPDPECGKLDYIMGEPRKIDTEFVQSNNFAFGGINTSLVIRRA